MLPWERRLRDLSKLLQNCGETYFSPELFRQNINQVLQTSRTVTFIIQKNKSTIPDYESWYAKHVLSPLKDDVIMTWAKDSRNFIEKEGDLEMYSKVHATLIFTHLKSNDIPVDLTSDTLLHADFKKIEKLIRDSLPNRVMETAALQVERRWVANSLPEHELVWALTYVYSSLYRICEALSQRMGTELDASIPHPTDLDPVSNDVAQSRFVKLVDKKTHRLKTSRMLRDPNFAPSQGLLDLRQRLDAMRPPQTLKDLIERGAITAEVMFSQNGGHFPMLSLYDDQWKQIDAMSTLFRDQTDKFLFWRMAAQRAAYLRARAFVWVSEVWIRDLSASAQIPFSDPPIKGEQLQVVGGAADGKILRVEWDILRPNGDVDREIVAVTPDASEEAETRMFFAEVMVEAMQSVRS